MGTKVDARERMALLLQSNKNIQPHRKIVNKTQKININSLLSSKITTDDPNKSRNAYLHGSQSQILPSDDFTEMLNPEILDLTP